MTKQLETRSLKFQGTFWPSENSAKMDASKVNRCRTSSQEKRPESFLPRFTLISGIGHWDQNWLKLANQLRKMIFELFNIKSYSLHSKMCADYNRVPHNTSPNKLFDWFIVHTFCP